MSKPTIVIIPGAWQKPVAFEGISKKLQDVGYETVIVPLLTVGGTGTPLAGLEDDVAAVRGVLKKLAQDKKKAVILCHSAGGLVASNSVSEHDNINGIIYLTAFMIPAGKALLDMFGGSPQSWMKLEGDRVTVVDGGDEGADTGLNDLSPEDQQRWAKEMTHTSLKLFVTPSGYEPWANGVPCAYIFASEDNAIPFEVQQKMASQLPGPEPATVTLKAGHCPHLSIPDQLVEAVQTLEARLK